MIGVFLFFPLGEMICLSSHVGEYSSTMNPPKELKPEHITAVRDTREQNPLDLAPLKVVGGTLTTGDYSLLGREDKIAIERKSLQDLVMCVGRERERFEREIMRLKGYESRAIVIEACEADVRIKAYRGTVHPNAILGSVIGWEEAGIPVKWAGDAQGASEYVIKFLIIHAKRRWREHLPFLDSIVNI